MAPDRAWSGSRRGARRRRPAAAGRRGVFLLVVMALVAMAGLLMVGVARHSLGLATEAIESHDALQRRWGTVSCQRAMLQAAPAVFDELERRTLRPKSKGPAPATLRASVALGGVQFDLILSDEDAKVNLNAVYQRRGRGYAQQTVVQLAGQAVLPVQLLPELAAAPAMATSARPGGGKPAAGGPAAAEFPPPRPAFRHWGEVFDLARAPDAAAGATQLPTITERLTCWGRGRINIRRAGDGAVIALGRLVVGEGVMRRIVDRYRANPRQTVEQIMEQVGVGQQERVELGQLLHTRSDCFSVWIRSQSSKRTDYSLAVAEREEDGSVRTTRFEYD